MKIDARTLVAANAAEKIISKMEFFKDNNVDNACPMEAAGFSVISSGAYGSVVNLPDGNVLKICQRKNDGYPMWAMWAQRNQGPGIPAIYWTQRINESLFFAAMPKYQSLSETDKERIFQLRDKGVSAKEGYADSYLAKAVRKVIEALDRFADRDMHGGNFMYCPITGEYKITDPYAALCEDQRQVESEVTGTPIKDDWLKHTELEQQNLPFHMVDFEIVFAFENRKLSAYQLEELDKYRAGIDGYTLPPDVKYLVSDESSWRHTSDDLEWLRRHPTNDYPGWNFYVKVIR